jgi:hypothetical protein
MCVLLDDDRLVAALKEVADVVVAAVEVVRIGAVHAVHAGCQIRFRSLDDHVEVIRHQAVRRTHPAPVLDNGAEHGQKDLPVEIIEEDRPSLRAT